MRVLEAGALAVASHVGAVSQHVANAAAAYVPRYHHLPTSDVVRAEKLVNEALNGLDMWAVKNIDPREAIDLLSGKPVASTFIGSMRPYDTSNGVLAGGETLDSIRFGSVQFLPRGTSLDSFEASARDLGLPHWGGIATVLDDDVFARSTMLAADRVPASDWGFMASSPSDVNKIVLERLIAEETVEAQWGQFATSMPNTIRVATADSIRQRVLDTFRAPLGAIELHIRNLTPEDIRGLYVEPARKRGMWQGLSSGLRVQLDDVARKQRMPLIASE
jgi:hypothetical protein